jgi:hypothetical protein
MPFLDVPAYALLHVLDACRLGWRTSEDRAVDVFGREPACTSHDDPPVLLIPFENGPGPKAELSTHLGGYGDLALCRQL